MGGKCNKSHGDDVPAAAAKPKAKAKGKAKAMCARVFAGEILTVWKRCLAVMVMLRMLQGKTLLFQQCQLTKRNKTTERKRNIGWQTQVARLTWHA